LPTAYGESRNWKKSIPKDVFYYRLRDSSSSWDNGTRARFTPSNICDCFVFEGEKLLTLELKNTNAKSLPYANIRKHQIDDLLWSGSFYNVISGFVINYDSLDECYFIEINDFKRYFDENDRKSLPVDYCRSNALKIENKRIKTNKKYDIKKFLKEVKKYGIHQ
jgi:recombination protein U